jgi:hypothetical protein
MKIYVATTGSKRLRNWCIAHDVGLLLSPGNEKFSNSSRAKIFIDNGAFNAWKNHQSWDEDRFFRLLEKARGKRDKITGVVSPDIVGEGLTSLEMSAKYYQRLKKYPLYLAVQDKMKVNDVIEHLKSRPAYIGIFIGGSLTWKWRSMPFWATFAHDRNLLCHAGRVGTVRGFQAAASVGVDSVDGSNLMRNNKLEEVLRYRQLSKEQKPLINRESWEDVLKLVLDERLAMER